MTSNPLSVALTRAGVAACGVAVGSSVGEGEGCSEGLGEEDGVGVADWSVKLAQGLGCTLAHSLWTPGASPERGWTRTLKLPLPSAVALPATLVVWSQYRLMCWLVREWPPVTLITVVAGPAVTSSERNALIGVGKGLGDGAGVGETTGLGDSAATVADGFFFQAEDGIRDYKVTGVQTCALPIYDRANWKTLRKHSSRVGSYHSCTRRLARAVGTAGKQYRHASLERFGAHDLVSSPAQIGRASCRERV